MNAGDQDPRRSPILEARTLMNWSAQAYGEMFGVDAKQIEQWEDSNQGIPPLVHEISTLMLANSAHPHLLHRIFNVESLDEMGVIGLLRFLRDASQSPIDAPADLEESLEEAIDVLVELAFFRGDGMDPLSPPDEPWEV